MATPSKETLSLLAELDAEFGKPGKRAKGTGADKSQYFNQAKHSPSTKAELTSAAAQLARTQFTNFEDWALHAAMLEANALAKQMDIRPSWIPDARITYVIVQHCNCCGRKVRFIGGEYMRFQSKLQKATIIRRAEVCPDLFLQSKYPDLIEEIVQTVARCPECIDEERKVEKLVDALQEANMPSKQLSFDFGEKEPT